MAPAVVPPPGVVPVPAPAVQRRVTSVLFGDLVGFTALSEARDAEDVRGLLTRYFDSASQVVARYGGTIEKFIGDAVMAVWGVPVAHEDDAERAIRSGLELVAAVAAFGESVGAPELSMRVGIVTGEVAVTVGATNQGMVAGDAVNTAARVQSMAEPGTVWIDGLTRSLTAGSIDVTHAGAHELKGKATAVELFAVTGVRSAADRDRGVNLLQAPLVGRDVELGVLKEAFGLVEREQRPRLVVVCGEAGVGKTRLSRELEDYLDGLPAPVLWHRGRCLAYGEGVAFSALTAAVRGRIGWSETDSPDTTRAKLDESLTRFVADAPKRARVGPALASLLGLPDAGPDPSRVDLFGAWTAWFEQLSAGGGNAPVVWVVDDAQHADEGLLNFIEHLATVAAAAILIVVMTRPELPAGRPGLTGLRRALTITLEPLPRADVAALLDGLVEGLPADVREALVERAEGNPLYAVETVRALHDQGLTVTGPTRAPGAVRLAGGVDAAALAALAAPASLQVLIASRLDLLAAPARAVLAAASVLGHTFSLTTLAVVVDSGHDLSSAVQVLVGRELLAAVSDRLSAEDGQYTFVQNVVRTVAYRTQSRRDRLDRHLSVVAHLEAQAAGDGDLATVIAQHLRDALDLTGPGGTGPDSTGRDELVRRLGRWLELSAQRSMAVGAPAAAMHALEEALRSATEPAEQIRLRVLAAEAARAAGALAECIEFAMPVITGELPADRAAVGGAVSHAAGALVRTGRHEDGWSLLQPYLAQGALEGLPGLVASRLAHAILLARFERGEVAEAAAWQERALRLAEDSTAPRELALVQMLIGVGHDLRGDTDTALEVLHRTADLAREHHLGAELGQTLMNLAAIEVNRDLAAAVDIGRDALDVLEQNGSTYGCWMSAVVQVVALRLTGRWDDIAGVLTRPLLQDRPPNQLHRADIGLGRAVVASARDEATDLAQLAATGELGLRGLPESADDTLFAANRALHARLRRDTDTLAAAARHTVQLSLRFHSLNDEFPDLWALVVGWLIDLDDLATARDLLRPVTDAPAHHRPPLLTAQLHRLRGTLNSLDLDLDPDLDPDPDADPGPEAGVEADLRRAITALDQIGAVPDRARAQATLGLWLTRQHRHADAEPELAAARHTFTALRATAWLRDLDTALSLTATG